MNARLCALGLVVVGAAACRDEQAGPRPRTPPVPGQTQAARPRPIGTPMKPPELHVELPRDLTFKSGASWANGSVIYVGSKVVPARAKPGSAVTVTNYFVATGAQPEGYQFFVHVVDPGTGQMLVNADHEIGNGSLPLGKWPVNQIVEDTSQMPVPRAPSGQVRLLLGFWRGDERLPPDNPRMADREARVIGPPIEIEDESLPEYKIHRTRHPPKIDGDLSDPAWQEATPVDLVTSFDGRKTTVRTTARMLYDDKNIYVSFDCEDPDVWGTLLKRDDPIYTQEAVEVFFDANADGKTYNELEVSPNNTLFDAYFPARREGMDLSWDSGMQTAVKVRGTINDPSDRDEGWTVEMAIPIARLADVPHIPPKKGDRWRFNLYRLEHLNRQQVEGQAFSPLFMGDFHNLPRFGWLTFE